MKEVFWPITIPKGQSVLHIISMPWSIDNTMVIEADKQLWSTSELYQNNFTGKICPRISTVQSNFHFPSFLSPTFHNFLPAILVCNIWSGFSSVSWPKLFEYGNIPDAGSVREAGDICLGDGVGAVLSSVVLDRGRLRSLDPECTRFWDPESQHNILKPYTW